MNVDPSNASTVRELLDAIRESAGCEDPAAVMAELESLLSPILVEIPSEDSHEESNPPRRRPLGGTKDDLPTTVLSDGGETESWLAKECAEFRFFVLEPRPGDAIPLGETSRFTIGRSRRCDIRTDDDSVSKVHASLIVEHRSGTWYVVDEHSRNGTCVAEEPLPPGAQADIWSGVAVYFGKAAFVFLDPAALVRMALGSRKHTE